MNYLVLGAGRMSYGIVHDFLNFTNAEKIFITDHAGPALDDIKNHFKDNRIETHLIGAGDKSKLQPLMTRSAGVISAVPYDYNYDLTTWAIEAGCHFVDLGGNNTVVDRQFTLHDKAQKAEVGVIPDCGLAPGMVSTASAYVLAEFDEVDTLEIRVGGLPLAPRTPLKYMLVFSVHGLINEYIENAVILKNGKITLVPSMTEVEELTFPEPFGKLEAFYTSGGTSTLPRTFENKVKHLNYKTIRYPGHCTLVKAMMDLGFTSDKKLDLGGVSSTHREVFEAMLADPLNYDGEDVVLIQIRAEGKRDGKALVKKYQAIEYGDKNSGLTAMMRTTAFPAALTLEMLVDGRISDHGVLRQELSVPPAMFVKELEKRNFVLREV